MKKTVQCRCKSECVNKRCVCLKNHEPCDEKCTCVDCRNPLNGVDVEGMTKCAIGNIQVVRALTKAQLDERYELPCGCECVALEDLIGEYTCRKCEETYW